MFSKKLIAPLLTPFIATAIAANVQAAEVSVQVTNLTAGMYFTPLFIAAHDDQFKAFELGMPASDELASLAEMGDGTGLSAMVTSYGGMTTSNNAPIMPGQTSGAVDFDTEDEPYLTVASMLLPTNDAFFAMNQWMIPSEAGTYTLTVHALDAGSEANNEIVGTGEPEDIPKPMFIKNAGSGATGVNASAENFVHLHRGGLGDDDLDGGASDLINSLHRWVGPVARITVVVK